MGSGKQKENKFRNLKTKVTNLDLSGGHGTVCGANLELGVRGGGGSGHDIVLAVDDCPVFTLALALCASANSTV
jgi:hypothetical protein